MIYACNKETHMCKCKTNTKEKACILKKPGVLDSVETNIGKVYDVSLIITSLFLRKLYFIDISLLT